MTSSELLKGTLIPIILRLLDDHGKMYGYEITQKVKDLSGGRLLIKEGSLYPALHKLLEEGMVTVETVNVGNRVRKYYLLSPDGKKQKNARFDELQEFMSIIQHIVFNQLKPSI